MGGVSRASRRRTVFFVSDRTGITVETLGHSLLSQFDGVTMEEISLPFVDSQKKALEAVARINGSAVRKGTPPLVFSTLIDPHVRHLLASSRGIFFDFYDTFIHTLEQKLEVKSQHTVGRSHALIDHASYIARIEAVNFALGNDDGASTQGYGRADVVVIGVSRSGKTPTCLYLALHYGIHAANYPLTEEDLRGPGLPEILRSHRGRLFGLSIAPERLHDIRSKRYPESRYASLRQCQREVRQAEALYRQEGIPFLNSTKTSVEEIAANMLHVGGLPRRNIR